MSSETKELIPQQGAGLATRPRDSFTLVPTNLGEAMEFSKLIASSELCPKEYRGKPQSVLIAVMMGAELSITPMQSIQNIAVINGRPTMWGDLVLALVRSSGLLQSIEERDAQEAMSKKEGRCEVHRKGVSGSTVQTFSYDMAEKAGLVKRGGPSSPWACYPGRMLQMRARSWALRDAFADVLKGLQVREEVEDYPDGPAPIQMPRRASDVSSGDVEKFIGGGSDGKPSTTPSTSASTPSTPSEMHTWTGLLLKVSEKSGETDGRKWTLHTIKGDDGSEFVTFSKSDAEFAASAGSSPVRIDWEKTTKGSKKILSIGPMAENEEPDV